MAKPTLAMLHDKNRFDEVAMVPKPLVYKEKETGHFWFLTNRRESVEVLDLYVALVDLGEGRMAYDSRRTMKFAARRKKPPLFRFQSENRFEKVQVDGPRVFQEREGKNLFFVDDSDQVLDRFICLWDINGKLVWEAKETNREKIFRTTKTFLEALVDVSGSPVIKTLFSGFGFQFNDKMLSEMKEVSSRIQNDHLDFADLVELTRTTEFLRAQETWQGLKEKQKGKMSLESLKSYFQNDPGVIERLSKLERFFANEHPAEFDDISMLLPALLGPAKEAPAKEAPAKQ